MAGFARVSGYSGTDIEEKYHAGLIDGYEQGYLDGHGVRKGLSISIRESYEGGSSSTTPYTSPLTGTCTMNGNIDLYRPANAALTVNGSSVWSKSIDEGEAEESISGSFTVQKGDVLVLRGWAGGGPHAGRCIVSMSLLIQGEYNPPTES